MGRTIFRALAFRALAEAGDECARDMEELGPTVETAG